MYKNIAIAVLLVVVFVYFWIDSPIKECIKPEPYQQNQMVDGCVMQKSGGTWIRTCG
jgi:hypothetical protein